ncbi:MAG TPA: extracellular solute-binding protein [Bacillota bacterium]|nr:extracellular solute-binding protein [Bacillota bacterium]
MPTYSGPQTSKLFYSYIEPFLRTHPNVTIELRVTTWANSFPALHHALKHGDAPDLLQTGTTWIGSLHQLGFLTPPPTDLEERPTLTSWIDETVNCDGVRFCVPWLTECSCLQTRSDVLDKMGIQPEELKSWDSFLNACHHIGRLTQEGQEVSPSRPLPIAITCRPDHNMLHNVSPWLWAGGWQIPDLDAPPINLLSSTSARPALEYLNRLLQTNPFDKNLNTIEPYLIEDFFMNEGRFAFYIGYCWNIIRRVTGGSTVAQDRWPIQSIPFPSGPAGSYTRGGGSVLAVSNQSQNTELAWELAQYLISDPFIEKWVQSSGSLPAHEGDFWQKYADNPEIAFLKDQIRSARTYPNHPLWRSIETILFKGLGQLLWRFVQGKPLDEEAQKLLLSTDKKINAILELAWDREGC